MFDCWKGKSEHCGPMTTTESQGESQVRQVIVKELIPGRGVPEARKLGKSLWAWRGNTLVSLFRTAFQVNPFKTASEFKYFK